MSKEYRYSIYTDQFSTHKKVIFWLHKNVKDGNNALVLKFRKPETVFLPFMTKFG
jgi:hypothetical protein